MKDFIFVSFFYLIIVSALCVLCTCLRVFNLIQSFMYSEFNKTFFDSDTLKTITKSFDYYKDDYCELSVIPFDSYPYIHF